MSNPNPTPDDARALLSDHIEGNLDEETRTAVDRILAADAGLAAQRQQLATTMQLLKGLPAPTPPDDLVGKVRDRLAAERRGAMPAETAAPTALPTPPRMRFGIELFAGVAAVASVVAIIAVSQGFLGVGGSAADGTTAAGIAAPNAAVETTWMAPGFQSSDIVALALRHDLAALAEGDQVTIEGERRVMARFVVALKEQAATHGTSVSGMLPDAERLRIVIKTER